MVLQHLTPATSSLSISLLVSMFATLSLSSCSNTTICGKATTPPQLLLRGILRLLLTYNCYHSIKAMKRCKRQKCSAHISERTYIHRTPIFASQSLFFIEQIARYHFPFSQLCHHWSSRLALVDCRDKRKTFNRWFASRQYQHEPFPVERQEQVEGGGGGGGGGGRGGRGGGGGGRSGHWWRWSTQGSQV